MKTITYELQVSEANNSLPSDWVTWLVYQEHERETAIAKLKMMEPRLYTYRLVEVMREVIE